MKNNKIFVFNIESNKYNVPVKAIVKSKKIDRISNELKEKIIECLMNATVLEDGSLIDDNVKGTSIWFEHGKANALYGENDKILNCSFECEIFDDGHVPDEESMKYSKAILNAIL